MQIHSTEQEALPNGQSGDSRVVVKPVMDTLHDMSGTSYDRHVQEDIPFSSKRR